jgi:hypothetical protein
VGVEPLARALWSIIGSMVGGAIFYFSWLIAFLLLEPVAIGTVEAGLWALAPIVTSLGFALGAGIVERRRASGPLWFLRLWAWSLVACALGAASLYAVGPMLIVFGMLGLGTASMGLRQALSLRQSPDDE